MTRHKMEAPRWMVAKARILIGEPVQLVGVDAVAPLRGLTSLFFGLALTPARAGRKVAVHALAWPSRAARIKMAAVERAKLRALKKKPRALKKK